MRNFQEGLIFGGGGGGGVVEKYPGGGVEKFSGEGELFSGFDKFSGWLHVKFSGSVKTFLRRLEKILGGRGLRFFSRGIEKFSQGVGICREGIEI